MDGEGGIENKLPYAVKKARICSALPGNGEVAGSAGLANGDEVRRNDDSAGEYQNMGNQADTEEYPQNVVAPVNRRHPRGQNLRKERRNKNMFSITRANDICKLLIAKDGSCRSPIEGEEAAHCSCSRIHSLKEFLEVKTYLDGPCRNFEKYGYCRYGLRCVFSRNHTIVETSTASDNHPAPVSTRELVRHVDKMPPPDHQQASREFQKNLRSSALDLPRSRKIAELIGILKQGRSQNSARKEITKSISGEDGKNTTEIGHRNEAGRIPDIHAELDSIKDWFGEVSCNSGTLVPRRDFKKPLDLRGKVYLAPLTTLGNLPFRRLCKSFGAEVTCSEMAVCKKLMQGNDHEWALLRRHKSEDIYGVQICGGFPEQMAQCAEAIDKSELEADFIDINMGCPLAPVTNACAGAALLGCKRRLLDVVSAVNLATSIPTTVKLRQGLYTARPLSLPLVGQLKSAGVSLISLHGRSKEQRYAKSADWDYISKCSAAACLGDEKVQFFGNGDIFSYEEYYKRLEDDSNLSGVMVGRAALIKPWVFTEIKEHRNWDISSGERLDILKQLCSYGLEYWGSDAIGVDTTRRMLCEWQSFMCRYVPIGILGGIPQKLGVRPAQFCCRDDLETLMASTQSRDWIKISEMLLGKAPPHFTFIPKHKSSDNMLDEIVA